MGLVSRSAGVVLSAAVVTSTAGCGGAGSAEKAAAAAAAVEFQQRAGSDPPAACALLAPGTLQELESSEGPCARSLPERVLQPAGRVRRVEVYSRDAWVRFDADVVFLARFESGWLVTAAGCTPVPKMPYDCELEGP